MNWKLYTLSHPATKEVFYIGVTKLSLADRLLRHISEAKSEKLKNKKQLIICKILNEMDSLPIIEEISSFLNKADAYKAEKELISKLQSTTPITNIKNGVAGKTRTAYAMPEKPPIKRSCLFCLNEVVSTVGKREKYFCSVTCRTSYHRTKKHKTTISYFEYLKVLNELNKLKKQYT